MIYALSGDAVEPKKVHRPIVYDHTKTFKLAFLDWRPRSKVTGRSTPKIDFVHFRRTDFKPVARMVSEELH